MSGNKKRPRAAPVSEEKAQPLKIDEDLLCLICTELVDDARHINCCGGLFCGPCIDLWMNREGGANQVCPNCRAVLSKANIIVDVRSDRKSAAQPRRCPFHERHDCEFVGTRQEVSAHKLACPCDPDLCTSKRCKAEKTAWEAGRTAERATWAREKSKLEHNIAILTQSNGPTAAAVKRALISAVLLSPDDILKSAHGFDNAKILTIDATKKYTIMVKNGVQQSPQDLKIEIIEANFNLTLFCYRPPGMRAPATGFPILKVVLTLVSFDPTQADYKCQLVFDNATGLGFNNWLTSANFNKYVKDGKFALGWTVTVVP